MDTYNSFYKVLTFEAIKHEEIIMDMHVSYSHESHPYEVY